MTRWTRQHRCLAALTLLAIRLSTVFSRATAEEPPVFKAADIEFFESKVRPILANRCQSCHGASKRKGGLRLDDREALLKGGDTGPAAVSGQPDESLLVEAIRYGDALQMPPKTRLPAPEVAVLTEWVSRGLPWPSTLGNRANGGGGSERFDIESRKAEHWAWRPIADPNPPEVSDTRWPAGSIDRFILAGLERAGLSPAAEADRRVLIRRLSFDLIGLPPSPAEVDAFLTDVRPDGYERLVDRLLGSPRFGERWARHWLDLARYAETRGHEFDPAIPNAWRYRDYVVRALNGDLPYDRFLTEHLAGDLLSAPRRDPVTGANESILGTGFWFLGEEVHSPVDIRQDETDRMDNRLDVMSKTFLGLTVACARCHDHKFDPIPQSDYYALSGFLISGAYRQVRFATMDSERSVAERVASSKDAHGSRLLSSAARALRPALEHLGTRLLAAGQSLTSEASRSTDPWVEVLRKALIDRVDPLHPFARLATERSAADPAAFRARLREAMLGGEPSDSDVVVDFGQLVALENWQNGSAFGRRPGRAGEVRVADGAGGPRLGVHDLSAASRDAGTPALKALKGDQRDHGKLGQWERPGQTLRSPEFTLRSGRLWYLVRGNGRAYASVNSHLVVAGPLHGAVLTEWKAEPSQGWRWVAHDLGRYKGNRLHVEFCPLGEGELSVARVVDSRTEPETVAPALSAVTRAITSRDPGTFDDLALTYESLLKETVDRLEAGRSRGETDHAALGDWLLDRLDAIVPPDRAEAAAFRREFATWNASRTRLLESAAQPSPTAPAMLEGNGVNEYLLIRGGSRTPGRPVPRRFLSALGGASPPPSEEGGGRLDLARRMLDPSNPFTARVMVNRIWHHLFGRGIVASVDNFGVLGESPTHPELLDHLATSFVRDGWSIKRLIRAIVRSGAYRMSSAPDSSADAEDPGNRLWHRRELRRLEAEPLRDAILAVSGRLDGRMEGPSVPVHLTDFLQGRGRPDSSGSLDADGRRSLYMEIRRNFLAPMMLAFDAPIPFTTMGRRNVSNVPAQALILLNDPFVRAEARRWAGRVSNLPRAEAVRLLYREAFARDPDDRETREAEAFLGDETPIALEDWADLAHVLLNSKEFLFIE